jgi:hypothetical protein
MGPVVEGDYATCAKLIEHDQAGTSGQVADQMSSERAAVKIDAPTRAEAHGHGDSFARKGHIVLRCRGTADFKRGQAGQTGAPNTKEHQGTLDHEPFGD